MKNPTIKIALAGNPNSGKTSLFNCFTGLNQHIGNYPGVTVDKKTGEYLHEKIAVKIIDLPGSYSLNPKSEDEKIATQILVDVANPDYPEIVIYVADASNLKRSLLLCSQIMDKGQKVILALNLMDVATENGILIDEVILEKELKIPVVAINARNKKGIDVLKKRIAETTLKPTPFLEETTNSPNILKRYEKIGKILAVSTTRTAKKNTLTARLDKLFLHPVFGYLFFLFILVMVFQSIFAWSAYPMEWIETGFSWLTELLEHHLPASVFTDLLINGVLAGLGGIVIFIPQIALLFFFVSTLEDSGYMTRVSFIMDKMLRRFGLNGKSVIPLISGVACAVPAIMSTRTIANKKERLLTIMVTPLMTCSARIPVYILIISIIIPNKTAYGIFNYQGLTLTLLYFLGIFSSFFSALVFKKFIKSEEKSSFIMEMPVFKMPKWNNIFINIYNKVKIFVFDAGKIILIVSMILWVLSSYGPSDRIAKIEQQYEAKEMTTTTYNQLKLENSYVGILGKAIEPAIAPMGFNWKMGIALITSFAAREVYVGTMATIYSVENSEDSSSIREKMMKEINPITKAPVYSFAVGVSLLLFYAFSMQCMSTIAIVYRETKAWKWPAIQFIYLTGGAYLASFIAFQLLK